MNNKILAILNKVKNKKSDFFVSIKSIRKEDIKANIKRISEQLSRIGSFVLLLNLFILEKVFGRLAKKPLVEKYVLPRVSRPAGFIKKHVDRAIVFLDTKNTETIKRVELIDISIRNMKAKRTRTYVTIGGMTIGIAIIVFLVSVGYGLERMVITRVARLDEMMQTDVSPQANGVVKINDKTLSDFREISKVDKALPMIAVVGRINYLNSVSDMPVYGVTGDYLLRSAIKPIKGKVFTSNEISIKLEDRSRVAGVSTQSQEAYIGQNLGEIEFVITPGEWISVCEKPSSSSKILGYTKRIEGRGLGWEVWGASYKSQNGAGDAGISSRGETLGKWVTSEFFLWKKLDCSVNDCSMGDYQSEVDSSGFQKSVQGFINENKTTVTALFHAPRVLGIEDTATTSATTTTTSTSLISDERSTTSAELAELTLLDIASQEGLLENQETKKVDVSDKAKREAVVNKAVLNILNLDENEAVGKKFSATFIITGEFLENRDEKIESNPVDYTIVAVTPDDATPFFYVPFVDLRTLGVTNYSQVKVVVDSRMNLDKVRRQIEAMGYTTSSVVDTVNQITSLFATVRKVLAVVGFVALIVAGLGMFNTLTVSLLERTREVGLMKAMGMKSEEVKELFLTESMIMGFFGGIIGIIVGILLGKIISLLLSTLAIFKGVGFIDIAHVPFGFIIIVVVISLMVGIVTGMYPAKRAAKISALNALRYE